MRIEQILDFASSVDLETRLQHWLACGDHDLRALARTDDERAEQGYRYCPHCWTAFARSGAALNPPLRRHIIH
jgi:hypothetical protein